MAMDVEVTRYVKAREEYRHALAGLIAAVDRMVASAPDARARLRQGEQTVELEDGGYFTVKLRSNGDIMVVDR